MHASWLLEYSTVDNRFVLDESLPSIISLKDIDPGWILVEICGDRDNGMYVCDVNRGVGHD